MKEEKMPFDQDVEDNKVLAAISYLWILCLIPLFLKRKSKFTQFHAKQGLLLFIVEVLAWLVFWIPVVNVILGLAIIILAALGILNAMQGKYWEMPILGKYAEKINLDSK